MLSFSQSFSELQRTVSSCAIGVFGFVNKCYEWFVRPQVTGSVDRLDASSDSQNVPNIASSTRVDVPAPQTLPKTISYVTVPGSWERRKDPSLSQTPSILSSGPKPQPGQIVYVTKGRFIAWGGTAVLEQLVSGDVIKTPKPHPYLYKDYCQNMHFEAQIYQRVGEHARVPKIVKWDCESCCLTMEYLVNGDLGEYIRQHKQSLTPELRLRWAKQAAEGLAVLHSVGVVHCDISPRNFLLDHALNLKISDFGGASLLGSEPSAVAGTRFRHPSFDWDAPPVFGDDIFSLGSLIYFIITGDYPYADRQSDEVEELYVSHDFPDVSTITCGSVIRRCWTREISTALEVYNQIEALEMMGL